MKTKKRPILDKNHPRRKKPRTEPRKEKRPEKRARLAREQADAARVEAICSAIDISQALGAQNRINGAPESCEDGLKAVNTWIASILRDPENTSSKYRITVLADYLRSETDSYHRNESDPDGNPDHESDHAGKHGRAHTGRLFPRQFFRLWHWSNSNNNEAVFSYCVSILANLTRICTQNADFALFGRLIALSALEDESLRAISRGLKSPKYADKILCPTLELLTNILTVDRGKFARKVYRFKDSTCNPRILAKNLSVYRIANDPHADLKPDQEPRVPARNKAIEYLVALLDFLDDESRSDLLQQGNVFRALFEHARYTPVVLLLKVLNTLKTRVVFDRSTTMRDKARIFNERNLNKLLHIARWALTVESDNQDIEHYRNLRSSILEYLTQICSTSDAGILPRPVRPEERILELKVESDSVNRLSASLEQESSDRVVREDSIHLYRPILDLTRALRPHACLEEANLLLKILKRAPTLSALYFRSQNSDQTFMEPKLTPDWIGYLSFLFRAIKQSAPFGEMTPSQSSQPIPNFPELIESILPQPLSAKLLTKCLNHKSELINFLASKVLSLAMEKYLESITRLEAMIINAHPLLEHTKARVSREFLRRCPEIKAIFELFRSTDPQKALMKESYARLLFLYYKTIPQMALREHFDISIPISQELQCLASTSEVNRRDRGLHVLILDHLVPVAENSPGFRWWNRSEMMTPYSPMVSILELIVELEPKVCGSGFRKAIEKVVSDHGFLQTSTSPSGVEVVIMALRKVSDMSLRAICLRALDQCINRYVRRTSHYEEQAWSLANNNGPDREAEHDWKQMPEMRQQELYGVSNPIVVCILEQWPFLENACSSDMSVKLGEWMRDLFLALGNIEGPNNAWVHRALRKMGETSQNAKVRDVFNRSGESSYAMDLTGLGDTKVEHEPSPIREAVATRGARFPMKLNAEVTHQLFLSMDGDGEQVLREDEDRTMEVDKFPDLRRMIRNQKRCDFPELFRWKGKDVEESLLDGEITALIACLCSSHQEVRWQASDGIQAVEGILMKDAMEMRNGKDGPTKKMQGVKARGMRDRVRTAMILKHLRNTAAPFLDRGGLPSIVPAFAAHAIPILAQPRRDFCPGVYSFLSKFVTRTERWGKALSEPPKWRATKLAQELVDAIVVRGAAAKNLEGGPPGSSPFWFGASCDWVLGVLLSGMQTRADIVHAGYVPGAAIGGGSLGRHKMTILGPKPGCSVLEIVMGLASRRWESGPLLDRVRDKVLLLISRAVRISSSPPPSSISSSCVHQERDPPPDHQTAPKPPAGALAAEFNSKDLNACLGLAAWLQAEE